MQIPKNGRPASMTDRTAWRSVYVPGAGHLFEEPGAIEKVSDLASAWFRQHLVR